MNTISGFADAIRADISLEVVDNANRHLCNPAAATVEVGDAHRLSYADRTFNGYFASSTLHHLEIRVALPEIRRILYRLILRLVAFVQVGANDDEYHVRSDRHRQTRVK